MGGLELYQDMSATGQRNDRGGGSEKILIGWLKKTDVITKPQTVRASLSLKGKEKADPELGYAVKLRCCGQPQGCKDTHAHSRSCRLLEVGALEPDNYGGCSSWIDCHPIDLRSRHSGILEQDFMLLDDAANCGEWDIISLSLVLNFVGNPHDRGTAQEARLSVDALWLTYSGMFWQVGCSGWPRSSFGQPPASSSSFFPFHAFPTRGTLTSPLFTASCPLLGSHS